MSRKTNRTRARDKKFFEILENGGLTMTVSKAAKAVGYSRRSVYDYKNSDPSFAERFEEIMEERYDELEATAYDMAVNGDIDYKVVVDRNGKKKTVPIKKRHAGIVTFLMSANRPEKYRPNYKPPVLDDNLPEAEIESRLEEKLDALLGVNQNDSDDQE
ncbi:hypothetical protein [Vibrio algivorus]|uniref:Helix-turn-helix domain-containing protein n=1 Tax=Vibrio algivorus TaxID=1667024 RepID=A0A557P335_9VIBR|nr:hypothetical protein [Vibrio algivorus]TVO35073.1 hypothetical protein FOF44_12280 [Vibrio algivorus]